MREGRKMKNVLKTMVLMVLLSMSMMTAKAQIFIMDSDEEALSDRDVHYVGQIPIPPINLDADWIPENYTPIGDGLFAMSIFGGAYLLTKKKRK